MEKDLFEWIDWDMNETMCFQFYNCTLKVPLFGLPVGTTVETIVLDYEKGTIEGYNDDTVIGQHNIAFVIKDCNHNHIRSSN